MDPEALATAKARLTAGNPMLEPAFHRLLSDANQALQTKPPSVLDKNRLPPSSDKHDFISQAPYFWPDTNSPGHYVHRDGERNPEAGRDSDAGRFGLVCGDVQTLALTFYFTGDEQYAAKAAEFLRVWFLNPATRMNPNLNYGQGIPGEVEGRPEGLISARGLVDVVDAVGLLSGSKSWQAADQQGMAGWCGQYLNWLMTSPIGLGEGRASNNHGTFYDTQVAALALFTGQTNLARQVLLAAREKRIASQIEPDGRQPRELARTLSFDYSVFNLRALMTLAAIGQNAGVDLWHYQTADGRSLLKALEFMAPYANPQRAWPYRQIHQPRRGGLGELVLRAAAVYPRSGLGDALKFFPTGDFASNPARLCFETASPDGSRPTTAH
ncbi:MAG: alginate lyase family protein [Limisphaerales bacterium]